MEQECITLVVLLMAAGSAGVNFMPVKLLHRHTLEMQPCTAFTSSSCLKYQLGACWQVKGTTFLHVIPFLSFYFTILKKKHRRRTEPIVTNCGTVKEDKFGPDREIVTWHTIAAIAHTVDTGCCIRIASIFDGKGAHIAAKVGFSLR